MRQLKFHEQKLLKKVNFYDWKSTRNVRESSILRKYQIEDREDYTKYSKLAGLITKLCAQLRKLKSSDEDRIKMTEILLCNFPGETFQDTLSFPAARSHLPRWQTPWRAVSSWILPPKSHDPPYHA
mmetsp:Transcript_13802/g.14963  ORF Transcript_13802/g.14963 Transcript_13802/m.14963 type:complete len:126 (+) Transcript_13802:66-443(+)